MSASTKEICNSLKKNGFDISLLELENILAILVKDGFIQREIGIVREQKRCVLNWEWEHGSTRIKCILFTELVCTCKSRKEVL
jgi:Fe2+ or Zn2+ uptake regulation protein